MVRIVGLNNFVPRFDGVVVRNRGRRLSLCCTLSLRTAVRSLTSPELRLPWHASPHTSR
jgi:hypothetical protein